MEGVFYSSLVGELSNDLLAERERRCVRTEKASREETIMNRRLKIYLSKDTNVAA
jgi:hypothetical protein